MKNNAILRIVLFTVVSLGWSYFYFVHRPFGEVQNQLPHLLSLLFMWLPTLGLVVCSLLLRPKLSDQINSIRLLGDQLPQWSLIAFAIPIVLLGLFGIPNEQGIQPNLYGLFLGVLTLIYALLEEIGWRGYLQEELKGLNRWIAYIIIGLIWYLWHWFFWRESATNFQSQLIVCLLLIGASAGIGEISKSSRSILMCAGFHALGNICAFFSILSNNLTTTAKGIIVGSCIICWVWIIKKMEAQRALNN